VHHSVLNAEAFTAVLFVLILLVRIRPVGRLAPEVPVSDRVLQLALAVVTLAAFWPALSMPLLYDSYGHVYLASGESFAKVVRMFVAHPRSGDFFFRPVGYLSFWIDGNWAGFSPGRWHAWSVSLHILNSLLVYVLAKRLDFGKAGALVAALYFALHGSRPEAVAWVAARFDLLAAFFSLVALFCVLRFVDTANRLWLAHVPATRDGVYFLKNSLPACILLNSKGALKQLPEISSDPIAGERVFQWNDADASFHTDHTNASRPRLHR
jgi:hypothetical protein